MSLSSDILVPVLLFLVVLLFFFLLISLSKARKLRSSLSKLMISFKELDDQAKLIVRTDLELNKTQEDLDRRLNGLDALQKISRLVTTTLDETEIFRRLDQPLLTELGFEKYLVLLFSSEGQLHPHVNFGFSPEEVSGLKTALENFDRLVEILKEEGLVSSHKGPQTLREIFKLNALLKYFVLTPILAQNDTPGLVIAGNQTGHASITEGDEELLSILADQIGQAISNARLFEKVYRSSQMQEIKVQDRTKQLSTALEEVNKISKAKSEFISAVSHELRTPLTSIKGYAALLMTGKLGQIPEKVQERLDKINKHSDNLVKLINDLLDISRIESGRIEMKRNEYHLKPMIESVADLLGPQLKDKGIHFVSEVPDGLPPLLVDGSQIERVFINLVSNAIKFTPADGTITIKVERNPDHLLVSAADSGIGIKKEDLSKLFNEFYRVENEINQNVKGTGLGLALTKKIIEAHGGKIWVESQVNKGTTFFFTLPFDRKS